MFDIKAIMAIIIAGLGALITALSTGGGTFSSVDTKHWLVALGTVLGSGIFVGIIENNPHLWIKAVMAGLTGGIGSLVIALNDNHITQIEWVTAFSVAATALLAVYQAPAALRRVTTRA